MKKTLTASLCIVIFSMTCLFCPVWAERINDVLVANDFIKETPKNTTLNFTTRDFTDSVNPPADSGLTAITFRQLTAPESGVLRLGTDLVTLDTAVATSQLDKLNFVPAKDYEGEAIFTWDAHYGTKTSPYPSAVTIKIGTGVAVPAEPSSTPEPSPTEEPTNTEAPAPTEEPTNTEGPAPTEEPENTATPSPTPTAPPQNEQKPLQYEDMLEHWGAYSAGMLGAEGVIIGEEIGGRFYFYPDKALTRMDFITLACSVFGIKTKDSLADNPFADEGVPSYMLRQAIAAYESGLIHGREENGRLYLDPYDRLTRVEAVKILDNGLKLEHPAAKGFTFADADTIPAWATQAVMNMEAYGIVKGYEDNTFRPYEGINKAQAGELLYQVFKYREKVRKTQSVFNTVFYGSV